jgi:cryptochrome
LAYNAFESLVVKIGGPEKPLTEPIQKFNDLNLNERYKNTMPLTLQSIGVDEAKCGPCLYPGGESEALRRFHLKFENEAWISSFEKPNTSPNSLEPSTTVLSPYLKFGNLSPKLFYWRLKEAYSKYKKHSQPPVSLEGQLLWREFFYFVGAFTDNFDRIEGNSLCRQIKWDNDDRLVEAWRQGKTGYPFIDAIMTQLREGLFFNLSYSLFYFP